MKKATIAARGKGKKGAKANGVTLPEKEGPCEGTARRRTAKNHMVVGTG